jgi:MFS family permease
MCDELSPKESLFATRLTMHLSWKPPRLFYGWWVTGACFLIALYTGGAIHYGFTAMFEPIANEFGWSYAQVSLAASLRGMEVGLLAPFMGVFVDRWGARRLMAIGAVITTLGLMLLSHASSLGTFYGAFILVAIGVSTCSSTVLMTAVGNWFKERLGIATGIMASGFGFGGLLVPVVVRLIDMHGWRFAIDVLALGMLIICLPLSLLVRHKPEQYGYVPDGGKNLIVKSNGLNEPAISHEADIKPRQAVQSSTFWHIALALMCQSLMVSAVVTHVMPYLGSIGFARGTSGLVASAIPLASISGRVGLGWLGDRLDRRWVAAGSFAMMSLGLLSFGFASVRHAWLLVLFLILFGAGYGGNNVLRASLIRGSFGRSNFGTIHGFTMGITMLGTIAGSPLAAHAFDVQGSYGGIWFVFAGLAIAALVMMATTPPSGTKIRSGDKA